jgi:hypothetical protein
LNFHTKKLTSKYSRHFERVFEEGDCQVTKIIEYNRRESGASDGILLILHLKGWEDFLKGLKKC